MQSADVDRIGTVKALNHVRLRDMIARAFRCLALRIELARNLRERRLARRIRAEAALRGKQTELRRRVQACRAKFGKLA